MRLKILSLLLTVTSFSGYAEGATRYVHNAAGANCSNAPSSGSASAPWCTINYAIGQIASGDTLYVKAGTYAENVYINRPAGSSASPTTISAYPGHSVVIRGSGNTGRVKITSTSYVTFSGFTVTNFNQGIFVEGGSHHVVVKNCTVHTVGQEGIHVKENSSYITIEGCTVFNTEQLGGCCNGEGIYVGTSSSGPLDNTHHVTIRNNRVHDTTDEGIELKPGTHDCVVEGNELYNIAHSFGPTVGSIEVNERDLIVQTWSGIPNHIIRNNVIHHSTTGIRLGTGSTAYNNVIFGIMAGHHGIYLDNLSRDNFTRYVYHNTIAMTSNAITIAGGSADIKNNIGPPSTNNVAFNAAYFINAAAHDYHLIPGAAPVNGGLDLRTSVPIDKDGFNRDSLPDRGAYELASAQAPRPPEDFRIIE